VAGESGCHDTKVAVHSNELLAQDLELRFLPFLEKAIAALDDRAPRITFDHPNLDQIDLPSEDEVEAISRLGMIRVFPDAYKPQLIPVRALRRDVRLIEERSQQQDGAHWQCVLGVEHQ
jgi:hypothetical protein